MRLQGLIADDTLVADVCWEHPIPGSPPNEGILWGTPEAMRRLTALLEAALGYAARGIPVYPVHWPHRTPGGANLTCSCPPRPRLRPAGQASPGPSRRLGGHH